MLTNSLPAQLFTVVHRATSITPPRDPVCVPDGQPLIKRSPKVWLSRSLQTATNLPTASLQNVTRKALAFNEIRERWQLFRSVGEKA